MARKNPRQAKQIRKLKRDAKKERRQGRRETPPSRALSSGLDEAEDLLREGELDEAVLVLEELQRRYPRRTEVLALLLDCYQDQQDMWSFQDACERHLALDATNADLWLAWAGAAVGNGQLTTAHHACDHFVNHWPDHPKTQEACEMREALGDVLLVEIAKYGLPQDKGVQLLRMHEEVNLQLHQGNCEHVCQLAEELLRQCPMFAPVLNNRSLARFLLGQLDQAVADARHVLEFDADNFHALSNLTRFMFLNGEFDEAREVAERLKLARSGPPDLYTKQAEALAFLGDWPGILETVQRAEGLGPDEVLEDFGLLFHLAGVAAAELGQLDVAQILEASRRLQIRG